MTNSNLTGSQARQRLVRDFKNLQKDPPNGINAAPEGDDIFAWVGIVQGPKCTPWEGGAFKLSMAFPMDYPMKPPEIAFITPIFHPNVYANGALCIDILQAAWAPVYDVGAILLSIQSLLNDPNPDSPADATAANLWQNDRREYFRKVRQVCTDCWNHKSLADLVPENVEEDEEYDYIDEDESD